MLFKHIYGKVKRTSLLATAANARRSTFKAVVRREEKEREVRGMDPVVHTLLSASEQGHKQKVGTLLAENAEWAEACDEEGSTLLMYAAANGRENVVQLLLQVRRHKGRGEGRSE